MPLLIESGIMKAEPLPSLIKESGGACFDFCLHLQKE